MKRFFLCFLLLCGDSLAADKYIRANATGANNGTSWTDAWTSFSSVSYTGMTGSTLWIAAGTYTTGLPDVTVSGVTIQRATTAAHGAASGWSDSYDGQVTHNSSSAFVTIESTGDDCVIDGMRPSSTEWLFRVVGQNTANGKLQIYDNDGVIVRGIEMDGNGCQPDVENGPEDGFRISGVTNLIVEKCYIHDYWYCTGSASNPGHSDGFQMPDANGVIIRYNWFQDCGMLLFFGDCTWTGYVNNIHIHHNVFVQQAATLGTGENNYRMNDMKGAGQTSTDYVIFENNTFYKETGFDGDTHYENTDCPANVTRRVFRNNIYINGTFGLSSGNGTCEYNVCYGGETFGTNAITSDPLFVSPSTFDFHLQSGSPADGSGTSTSLGYGETLTVDYDGVAIATPPSRGAFEFVSAQSATINVGTLTVGP